MSGKNKKQFGVWMDTRHAIIMGRENIDSGDFTILGRVNREAIEVRGMLAHDLAFEEIVGNQLAERGIVIRVAGFVID